MPKFDFSRHALPTPYERELLTLLIEEAAEVQQRATKMLRFGNDETQPGQDLSNRERLSLEIGDMQCVLALMVQRALVLPHFVYKGHVTKDHKLKEFMQHEPD
jgi:hypothetical protein